METPFHQELYALSPLDVVQAEVERLWWLSNVYRMVNFEHAESDRRAYAVGYYHRMLDALAVRVREALVKHVEELRERTQRSYSEKRRRRLGA